MKTRFSLRNGTSRAFCQHGSWNLKSQDRLRTLVMKPITQENSRLGFVGVGYMGQPIARRLLEAGFKLTVYDRDHSKAEELIRYGATVAENISRLSASCNVVLSCLLTDEAVLNIYRGPGGAFANAQRGS